LRFVNGKIDYCADIWYKFSLFFRSGSANRLKIQYPDGGTFFAENRTVFFWQCKTHSPFSALSFHPNKRTISAMMPPEHVARFFSAGNASNGGPAKKRGHHILCGFVYLHGGGVLSA
jgi:hypothetical protein